MYCLLTQPHDEQFFSHFLRFKIFPFGSSRNLPSCNEEPKDTQKHKLEYQQNQMARTRVHPPSASPSTADTGSLSINPKEISSNTETKYPIVLVIGLTGAGKTTFINHVTNSKLAVGRGMDACTTTSSWAVGKINGVEVAFVDTPGFDDPMKSDAEILIDITNWIGEHLGGKTRVTAALYLHSILTKKAHGSATRNFSLFSSLVGTESMANVGLVTTHWDIATRNDAIHREAHFVANSWTLMLANGARIYRLHNDPNSAQSMMVDMLEAQPSFIKIQKEMASEFQGKGLSRTEAGEGVYNELLDRISGEEKDAQNLKTQLAKRESNGPELNEALEKQLDETLRRLDRMKADRQRVEKIPSWGEKFWGFTKTHAMSVALQVVQYTTTTAATGAALGAARDEITHLQANLAAAQAAQAASQAAAQAAAQGHTTSYASAGAVVGLGLLGLKLLGWA